MGTVIQNGIAITETGEEALDILLLDGKIATLGKNIPLEGHTVYDAAGCLVFPGFIDAHTHLEMDNGVTVTADSFASGTAAALCGGTTTIIDFATQSKGESLHQALANWHRKADGNCRCDYAFHMAMTDWNDAVRAEVPQLCKEGVTSFKLYMAYDALRMRDSEIYAVLRCVHENHGIVGVHCENGDLVNALVQKELSEGHYSPAAHPLSRPDYVEAEAVARFCAIGRAANAPVHVVHLSTAAGLQEARRARMQGQTVYLEGCPQYFTLDESRYLAPGFEGAKYVCSPPLRAQADVNALWQALIAGEINSISTDHCSFNFKGQKTLGEEDFSKIPNGMPGIEHRAAIMLSEGKKRGVPYTEMEKLLSTNAARLFGLYHRKGSLAIGKDADIVIYNPNAPMTIRAADMMQNVDYTPFEGLCVSGSIQAVFLAGTLCCENQKLINDKRGRFIPRRESEYL